MELFPIPFIDSKTRGKAVYSKPETENRFEQSINELFNYNKKNNLNKFLKMFRITENCQGTNNQELFTEPMIKKMFHCNVC